MMERFLPPTPNMSQHSLASFLNFFILYFIYTTHLTHPDTLAQRQVERKFKSNPRSSGKKKNCFMEPKIVLPNNIYIQEKSPQYLLKDRKNSPHLLDRKSFCVRPETPGSKIACAGALPEIARQIISSYFGYSVHP